VAVRVVVVTGASAGIGRAVAREFGARGDQVGLLARGHGTIVQVGSTLAYRGIPLQSAYCGAKHAIQGFTEALRCELLHQNSRVRITMVQLPAVNTPVRLGAQPPPQPSAPSRAGLPARGGRQGSRIRRRPPKTSGVLGRRQLGRDPGGEQAGSGVLDRYLARTGYEAQQTDLPADPNRPVNLWEPVDGRGGHDVGAHGSFDDEAVNRSLQAWVGRRPGLAAAASGLLAGLLAVRLRRR